MSSRDAGDAETTPLADLTAAVQAFVALTEEEAAIVVGAVLVVELATWDDEGEQMRRITYSTPCELISLAGSIGLCRAGERIIMRDVLDSAGEQDDEL